MLKTPYPEFPFLKVLGDTHLGKRFVNDVPMHRRGDREQMVRDEFVRSLHDGVNLGDIVVQTGDIFDGFTVDNATVIWTAEVIKRAHKTTGASYIIYRGNHDASRDEAKRSSFDLLQAILQGVEGISVLSEVLMFKITVQDVSQITLGFLPWHPFKPAQELAERLGKIEAVPDVVFTHCDLDSFGENTFNVLPYAELSKITTRVVNGHIHTPEERTYGDTLKVVMVGSMQPYSHSEDPEGVLYKTFGLREYAETNTFNLKDVNVRILLQENENLPDEVPDCLSFSGKRVKSKEEVEDDDSEVHVEDFDMGNIIQKALITSGIVPTISKQILECFQELRNKE